MSGQALIDRSLLFRLNSMQRYEGSRKPNSFLFRKGLDFLKDQI
jgi:hypothetical protein